MANEDDFDFGDLGDLDLDAEEKAWLAGEHATSSTRLQSSVWTNSNSTHGQSSSSSTSKTNSGHPSNNNGNRTANNHAMANGKSTAADDFDEFGDLGDEDMLLDDADLLDGVSSGPSNRLPYFQVNAQQQQLPFRHPAAVAGPHQPPKLFSIFGGAQGQPQTTGPTMATPRVNQVYNKSNNIIAINNNPQRQGPLAQNHGFLVSGNVLGGARSSSNTMPPFQQPRLGQPVIPRADPTNDFATDVFKSPEPLMQYESPTHHLIDKRAALTWQYPINYPKRDYQYNIIRQALFTNTLVSLPTGLGKTFIAAVVMLNYFRWFPRSKIIFMAPTRPLVNQQIEACFNICGIPQEDTIELTGQQNAELRKEMWKTKRLIFCTPQVAQNDLKSDICPAEEIVCLVVDEAHRATGRYAYAEVVRLLEPVNRDVRIMALTATPGSDIRAVQQVVQNLKVAKIAMRTEDSLDLREYVFKRVVQEIVVPCGREVGEIRDKLIRLMRPFLDRLAQQGIIRTTDPSQLTRFSIISGRDTYIREHPQHSATKSFLMKQAGIALGLIHAHELLTVHGIRPFFTNMDPLQDRPNVAKAPAEDLGSGSKGKRKKRDNGDKDDDKPSLARKAMEEIPEYMRMMDGIRLKMKQSSFVSHPKLERLVGVVVQHFIDHQDENDSLRAARELDRMSSEGRDKDEDQELPQTRVMIFANYRESVEEISRVLEPHRPLIKVQSFIGQATAKGKKGISQKDQQKVVADFQKGNHNVLVATSIGEEGLDIGDVDLIVCYDTHSSPIRMLQRMGRTGRKRAGKICMLLAEGQEEQKHKKSQASYKTVQRAIAAGTNIMYYPHSPKILPPGPPPTCDLVHINVPTYITPTGRKRRKLADDGQGHARLVAQGAYLDGEELARFQQRYRLPKRQVIQVNFQTACTKLSKNPRRATLTANTSSRVGHSTTSTNFISILNQISKARVEQSLHGVNPSRPDSYSKRMQSILDRHLDILASLSSGEVSTLVATSGSGSRKTKEKMRASRATSPDLDSDRAEGDPTISKFKYGGIRDYLYSNRHSSPEASHLDDEEFEAVEQSLLLEMDPLAEELFGVSTKKQLLVRPRPAKKALAAKSKNDSGSGPTLSRITSTIDSTAAFFGMASTKQKAKAKTRAISDDEVDMEIMDGGFGSIDQELGSTRKVSKSSSGRPKKLSRPPQPPSRSPPLSPPLSPREPKQKQHRKRLSEEIVDEDDIWNLQDYTDGHDFSYDDLGTFHFGHSPRRGSPSLPSSLTTNRVSRNGFDFREPLTPPPPWFKPSDKDTPEVLAFTLSSPSNMEVGQVTRGVSKKMDPFVVMGLPPVPAPGQWYAPSEPVLLPSSPQRAQAGNVEERSTGYAIGGNDGLQTLEQGSNPGDTRTHHEEEIEEVLFIESSEDEETRTRLLAPQPDQDSIRQALRLSIRTPAPEPSSTPILADRDNGGVVKGIESQDQIIAILSDGSDVEESGGGLGRRKNRKAKALMDSRQQPKVLLSGSGGDDFVSINDFELEELMFEGEEDDFSWN